MNIRILNAESLGARGLACSIQLKQQKILIDPGVALGWSRHGLLPHPFQVAVGAEIRQTIINELEDATDVVFSHYHGDHCPLLNPNPYQLGINDAKDSLSRCRIWAGRDSDSSPLQKKRRDELKSRFSKNWHDAEGTRQGPIEFSVPVPHGEGGGRRGMVMMTRIEEEGLTFVHASDIQLLNRHTIELISGWEPDIVLASGPPLYHYSSPAFQKLRDLAWENALELSRNTETLIIDHHLLRSEEGLEWLAKLKESSANRVLCAAEFMEREPILPEAWRSELYKRVPVPENWHEDYSNGKADTGKYLTAGWKALISEGKIKKH